MLSWQKVHPTFAVTDLTKVVILNIAQYVKVQTLFLAHCFVHSLDHYKRLSVFKVFSSKSAGLKAALVQQKAASYLDGYEALCRARSI